jgi:hypothetical protein
MIMAVLVTSGVIYAAPMSPPNTAAQKALTETRQALRQQGFKTDLTDFDFSTTPELRAREAILKAAAPDRTSVPSPDQINLMEAVGAESAIILWKQDSLKLQYRTWPDNSDEMSWDALRQRLNENRPALDAACVAALSSPIVFNLNANAGGAMLLPHLAVLKNLTQTLGCRVLLVLHDGNQAAAWTNLMAATCLVTAWKTEPAEVSHLVRFGNARLVFDITWQALQTNGWTDDQLARLQQEWESADFLTDLPEIAAFRRASDVKEFEYDELQSQRAGAQPNESSRPSFDEFLHEALSDPFSLWGKMNYQWSQREYFRGGMYEDEKDLLLFYRDRELELRKAVQAQTWAQMRQLPGVTNKVFFQSKYPSRIQSMLNLHEIQMAFLKQGATLLGRAAEAEARRRILIAAITLERYRGKYGSYPNTLGELAPEFLKTVPLDFMDGQPFRYRLIDGSHFLLYSVGLDCVDHGGKLPAHEWETRFPGGATRYEAPPPADIVWPLPASPADVMALRQREERAEELRNMSALDRESEEDWQQSPLRQARVEKILAMDWTPDTNMEMFAGRRVVDMVSNEKISVTNQPSLAELLTPKQIITGGEPENLTFGVRVSYDAITNLGSLILLVDADPAEPMGDSGGRIQDCNRAGNGDCLLVWHTIFDPPGRHAVQVQLVLSTRQGGEYLLKGPAIPVVTTNLCQFSLNSATYSVERGAIFHARLPETNGLYTIECLTTNGEHLKILSGSTSNGEFNVLWNLVDDRGHRLTGETFNSIVHIALPDSGRSQTLRGP